ncbi:hypothetical protein Z951_34175 [Streptomyces sp. PRh5]|nr:hypothetical protein Z951_34175 [Streptomyces sp. PRh5]
MRPNVILGNGPSCRNSGGGISYGSGDPGGRDGDDSARVDVAPPAPGHFVALVEPQGVGNFLRGALRPGPQHLDALASADVATLADPLEPIGSRRNRLRRAYNRAGTGLRVRVPLRAKHPGTLAAVARLTFSDFMISFTEGTLSPGCSSSDTMRAMIFATIRR